MRALTLLVAALLPGVCMAAEIPDPRGESTGAPFEVPAGLAELPWTSVGHLDVPGFNSLVNIGFIFGQYPQPPALVGSMLFVPGGSYTRNLIVVDLANPASPRL